MSAKEPSKDFRQKLRSAFREFEETGRMDESVTNVLALCKEMLVEKSQIRDLILDDVPHQYQKRLLEVLDGKQ